MPAATFSTTAAPGRPGGRAVIRAQPNRTQAAARTPRSQASDDAGAQAPDGLEVYGDSAYGSGEARRLPGRRARHHHQAQAAAPAVPGGFTLDDFTISEQDGTVTCPAAHKADERKRTVTFGALCAACPLRDRCTTAKMAGR